MSVPTGRTQGCTDMQPSVELLRAAMVKELQEQGFLGPAELERAFQVVPRHVFAPGESLEDAYRAMGTVVPLRDEQGRLTSVVSSPHIQASMLKQLDVKAGMKVLEIGSAGYNAALLAELVGCDGEVTTIDIDPQVTARSQRCLSEAGYDDVNVVLADTESGVLKHAPYDRIIVTVGAWDIPPAWFEQLANSGRIVVPFRLKGLTRSIAFDKIDGKLVSDSCALSAFVPMQGQGAHKENSVRLDEEAVLFSDETQSWEQNMLRDSWRKEPVEYWSDSKLGDLPHLCLWLSSMTKDSVVISRKGGGAPAWVRGNMLTTFTWRRVEGEEEQFETGIRAYGVNSESLAMECIRALQFWGSGPINAPQPKIVVEPISSPVLEVTPSSASSVINKKHTRVKISWPYRSDNP